MSIEFKTVNLNDKIRYRMNAKGEQIWRDHYTFSGIIPKMPKTDSEGWVETQFWEFMQVFGSHVGIGFNLPIETNVQMQFP